MNKHRMDLNDADSITKFFTALGDPIRIQITQILGIQGKMNVGDIANHFDVSRPSISRHLKVLKDSNIVDSKKVGQEVFYWLSRDMVAANFRLLAEALSEMKCDE
ncbi:helix-turn-helix transcriptional regulator [Hazenella sp. IB182357]|uniref:Helix-turn-helix transcriptional regulator n=1 Tax=Polycladospora coralii TaxID=2771432 RepID=A0A926RY98_9BACL|nr:metalloregulator ArsR/SmtB family transcription factor [Polycladospora coralii]MBD1373306.1 helix-turn-helix transcriptional regulator [Polycladospora coralii]MBS7528920.1 helix-turn-helix transcriptional regulator [Polycladospora coralii]